MRHVAFLRNVNQGQRGHPTTADIVSAFEDAGAREVIAFQSNGTIIFDARTPQDAIDDAMVAMAERSGLERDAFGMPLAEVIAIVASHAAGADLARRELTLHGGSIVDFDSREAIQVASHRRCAIVAAGEGWFVSINERDRESNATPIAEILTGAPATSRGLPTLVRLVDRFAREEADRTPYRSAF